MEEYLITDKDLWIHVIIPRNKLEDQTFDLVGWYIEFLSQRKLYYPSNETRTSSVDSRAGSPCCSCNHLYVGCSQLESEDQCFSIEDLMDPSNPARTEDDDDILDLVPVVDAASGMGHMSVTMTMKILPLQALPQMR